LNSGLYNRGNRFRISIPNTAVSDARRIVSSNVTGMNAGRLKSGLPLTKYG
jgi:hypothetical protein